MLAKVEVEMTQEKEMDELPNRPSKFFYTIKVVSKKRKERKNQFHADSSIFASKIIQRWRLFQKISMGTCCPDQRTLEPGKEGSRGFL